MTDRALLQQALDALENHGGNYVLSKEHEVVVTSVIAAIRQRLAQPEAPDCGEYGHAEGACGNASCMLSAAPQKGPV